MPSYVCVNTALEDSFLQATKLANQLASACRQQREAHESQEAEFRTILVAHEAEIRTIIYTEEANVLQQIGQHKLALGVLETKLLDTEVKALQSKDQHTKKN